jgi:hypothetical protein
MAGARWSEVDPADRLSPRATDTARVKATEVAVSDVDPLCNGFRHVMRADASD